MNIGFYKRQKISLSDERLSSDQRCFSSVVVSWMDEWMDGWMDGWMLLVC
jgi:hypothetical protein